MRGVELVDARRGVSRLPSWCAKYWRLGCRGLEAQRASVRVVLRESIPRSPSQEESHRCSTRQRNRTEPDRTGVDAGERAALCRLGLWAPGKGAVPQTKTVRPGTKSGVAQPGRQGC
jgi:hypothetical protein